MQDDEEGGESKGGSKGEPKANEWSKPKWNKGKKVWWDEDDEKGMSSWGGHSSTEDQEAYEAE
eukprot:8987136-Karenia_brevis.AAC.1